MTQPGVRQEQDHQSVPELGHLVDGYDFRGLVAWAQSNPPVHESAAGFYAQHVTIGGNKAQVGWVKQAEGEEPTRIGHQELDWAGDLFFVDGAATFQHTTHFTGTRFQRGSQEPPVRTWYAEGPRPGHVGFPNVADYLDILSTAGPDEKMWIVTVGADAAQKLNQLPEPVLPDMSETATAHAELKDNSYEAERAAQHGWLTPDDVHVFYV